MLRRSIPILALSVIALASVARAAPTAAEKCQAAKLDALRKQAFCVEGEHRKDVLGMTPDTAKCADKFAKAIMMADMAAAKKSASCRWLDNADGTATDLNTGLQWELKNDNGAGDVHDKDNRYTWNTAFPGTTPNGTAYTAFLGTLNGGVSADGSTTTGCFADHCDWRLPTIGELRGILDAQKPNCTINPCTTIPGLTGGSFLYWSSSSNSSNPANAWIVFFGDGLVDFIVKDFGSYARAVRGGS